MRSCVEQRVNSLLSCEVLLDRQMPSSTLTSSGLDDPNSMSELQGQRTGPTIVGKESAVELPDCRIVRAIQVRRRPDISGHGPVASEFYRSCLNLSGHVPVFGWQRQRLLPALPFVTNSASRHPTCIPALVPGVVCVSWFGWCFEQYLFDSGQIFFRIDEQLRLSFGIPFIANFAPQSIAGK